MTDFFYRELHSTLRNYIQHSYGDMLKIFLSGFLLKPGRKHLLTKEKLCKYIRTILINVQNIMSGEMQGNVGLICQIKSNMLPILTKNAVNDNFIYYVAASIKNDMSNTSTNILTNV